MKDIAIEVKDLVVRYRSMHQFLVRTSIFKLQKGQKKEYTALNNISFSVEKGQIVGIIGKNGSGKSTLLRTIGGIFSADEGSINLYDNSVSLLSIGVGFQSQQTGRTNIMLSGLLLGFTKEQINERMQQIIEFADLGEFIDYPVKTYSSGMHSKLAFSIGAFLETDILLIDEVLSVGDAEFKVKSFNKMKELIQDHNRTVIIVSHNMGTIKELCDKVLWLHKGKLVEYGEAKEVVKQYKRFTKGDKGKEKNEKNCSRRRDSNDGKSDSKKNKAN